MDVDTAPIPASTKIIVTFLKKKISLTISSHTTVSQLKQTVLNRYNALPENNDADILPQSTLVKFILRGKTLDDSSLILAGGKTIKLLSLVQKQEDLKKHAEEEEKLSAFMARRSDSLAKGRRTLSQSTARFGAKARGRDNRNKFHRISTLKFLPDEAKAQAILKSLATDPGILSCLKKHDWSVGTLAEMYPRGKVGVDPVCVLGLNTNKGQKIELRLRTDDLKGFRKMENIRKVLYHELSHNDISEHDASFFALMRQVERECVEGDWTGGAGITAGDDGGVAGQERGWIGGSGRLGGPAEDGNDKKNENKSKSALMGNAALLRLSQEEKDVCGGCGCGREQLIAEENDIVADNIEADTTVVDVGDEVNVTDIEKGDVVWYHDKVKDEEVKATVVGVHIDYDEQKNYVPFFTITFLRDGEKVEKQTDASRLKR